MKIYRLQLLLVMIIAIGGIFLLPQNVFAQVIAGQGTVDDDENGAGNFGQSLGLGLTGSVSRIDVWVQGDNGTSTIVSIALVECNPTGSASSTPDLGGSCNDEGTPSSGDRWEPRNADGTDVECTATTAGAWCSFSFLYVWSNDLDATTTNPTLDPSRHHLLIVNNLATDFEIAGNSVNTIPGKCLESVASFGGLNLCDDVMDLAFWIYGGVGGVITSTDTRFTSVLPLPDSTQSTSSAISFKVAGYVNPNDFKPGDTEVFVRYYRAAPRDINWFGEDDTERFFDITAAGNFEFTWSDDSEWLDLEGVYAANAVVRSHRYSIFGFAIPFLFEVKATVLWNWLTGSPPQSDIDAYSFGAFGEGVFDTASSTATFTDSHCNLTILNTAISRCITSLFTPSADELQNLFDQAKAGFLSKLPWGYVTRFVAIMSGDAGSVEPPHISYTFGTASPEVLQGETIDINIWDYTDTIATIEADDGSGKNLWDIVNPFFYLITSVGVLMVIMGDMTGLSMRSGGGKSSRGTGNMLGKDEQAVVDRANEINRTGSGMGSTGFRS